MTPQAREAILAADRVVGYLTYLDLIADLIADKEKVGTAMMQEVDRCQQAVDLAIEGHEVVVISSGDSGIYGMAGLVMELANKVPAEQRPQVDIVPGLSAVNVAGCCRIGCSFDARLRRYFLERPYDALGFNQKTCRFER